MSTKLHTHHLPYTPEQIYDLVADVEKYPEFLPWCQGARILTRSETDLTADVIIGYKIFSETFRSRVRLTPKSRIEIEYLNGPFHYLNNRWEFKAVKDGGVEVTFFIEFEFKNSFFQGAIQAVFEKAFDQMIEAFEKRAEKLYG